MHRIAHYSLTLIGTVATGSVASAGIVFQQDFSSSSTLGDYVSATPNSGQFHDISADGTLNTVAVSGGQVVFDLEPDPNTAGEAPTPNGGMLRADMTNTTGLMTMKMVFTYTRETAVSNFGPGPSIQIGDFPTNATNYRSSVTADRFDEIGFRRNGASSYWIELSTTDRVSANFGQAVEITYFLNDSGATANYVGPDGVARVLNTDSVALFVGTTLVAHNHAATNGSGSDLTGFRFLAIDGSSTDFAIDSIVIRDDLGIVPEPASLALLAIGGVTLLTARRGRAA